MNLDIRQILEDNSIPEPNTGCLLWTGTQTDIYGAFRYNNEQHRAHRASYIEYNGEIPKHLVVRHKCNMTFCIEPTHLVLGTHQDNMNDRKAAGRYYVGERNSAAVLSEEEVYSIREDCRILEDIASEYCISKSSVWNIQNRKTWKHLPERS